MTLPYTKVLVPRVTVSLRRPVDVVQHFPCTPLIKGKIKNRFIVETPGYQINNKLAEFAIFVTNLIITLVVGNIDTS